MAQKNEDSTVKSLVQSISQRLEKDDTKRPEKDPPRPKVQNLRQIFRVEADSGKNDGDPNHVTSLSDRLGERVATTQCDNAPSDKPLNNRDFISQRTKLFQTPSGDIPEVETALHSKHDKPAVPVKPKLLSKPKINPVHIKSKPQVKEIVNRETAYTGPSGEEQDIHNKGLVTEGKAISDRIKALGDIAAGVQNSDINRPADGVTGLSVDHISPAHKFIGGTSYAIIDKEKFPSNSHQKHSQGTSETDGSMQNDANKKFQLMSGYEEINPQISNVNGGEKVTQDGKGARKKEAPPKQKKQAYDGVILLPKDKSQVRQAFTYDGVVLLSDETEKEATAGNENRSNPGMPPVKPPRTFAHDIYREAKGKATAQNNQSDGKPSKQRPTSGRSNLYEEIGPSEPSKSPNAITRPTSRPPPPPRPPLPRINVKLRRELSMCEQKKNLMSLNPYSRVLEEKAQLPSDAFVSSKKGIRNPSYERESDVLKILTKLTPKYLKEMEKEAHHGKAKMKRANSDEFLYADPQKCKIAPAYFEPRDSVRYPNVEVDSFGYAVPHIVSQETKQKNSHRRSGSLGEGESKSSKAERTGSVTMPKNMKPKDVTKKTPAPHHLDQCVRKKRPPVREKISAAYSILRRRRLLEETDEDDGFEIVDADSVDDSDSLVDMAEHTKRLLYVNSMRELQHDTIARSRQARERVYHQLFEYAMIVGLMRKGKIYEPYVRSRFPEQIPNENNNIPWFCFPDAEVWQPVTHYTSESFSFVLTAIDGTKQYGYCRRLLPPGTDNRLPEVFCIVSPLAAFGLYFKVLDEIEKCRQSSIEQVQELIKAAFGRPLPSPGKTVTIQLLSEEGEIEKIEIQRQADARLENVNFDVLTSCLDTENLIKIFASLLLEKRIIFAAKTLSTLSSCIHAIISLLYPFTWQHTFVPVLPSGLLEFCCSPTPYVIGLLSANLPQLQNMPIDEVLVIDLDENKLLVSEGTEGLIIPSKLQKALQMALSEDSDVMSSSNVVISEAFMRLFIETVGHYSEFISTQQDGMKIFQKDLFIKAVSSKSIRLFLEWLTETQMFEVYITDKLHNSSPQRGLFETRIEEYREEMLEESTSLRSKMKVLGKKMINLGGKIKKAFTPNKHVYV